MSSTDNSLKTRWVGRLAVYCGLMACLSCTPDAFFNNTASLGGSTPGGRGNIDVSFVNKTPFRAILTFGTYDPQNYDGFPVQFGQFAANPDPTVRLEGNSEAGPFTFPCGRVFSLGGEEMIEANMIFFAMLG